MRKIGLLAAAGFSGFLLQAAWGQQPTFLVPGLHPALTLTNMRPVSSLFTGNAISGMPNVASMAWLPNGTLFIAAMDDPENNEAWEGTNGNTLGPSNGYLFTGLPTAVDSSGVTASIIVTGFHEPLGAAYANGNLYVTDDSNGIEELVDSAGVYSKKIIYSGLLGHLTGQGGTNNYGDRRWDAGLLYRNGYFYSAVGMGFPQGGTSDTTVGDIYYGRGCILQVPLAGGVADTFACGVRNPTSMAFGPDSEMFYMDNQGSWEPEGGFFDVRQGRFFGHPFTPYQYTTQYPPAVVLPYGNDGTSGSTTLPLVDAAATQPLWLTNGPYAGQWLIGENHASGINRIFMEVVNGEYQGAVFPFSQGLGVGSTSGTNGEIKGKDTNFTASVNSMSYGPDGNIYIGGGSGIGSNSSGAWGFAGSHQWGLARLTWKDTTVFEMKAIRSLGSTQMQIQFTEPVTPSTVVTSNFKVQQWEDISGGTGGLGTHGNNGYGAGQAAETATLQVNAATLDSTGTKVTLTIAGLKQRSQSANPQRGWGYVQQIWATGITAVSGHSIWGGGNQGGAVGWYTTNYFGPGTDVSTSAIKTNSLPGSVSNLNIRWESNGLWVRSPTTQSYMLRVLDIGGRTLGTFSQNANSTGFLVPANMFKSGLSVLELRTAAGERWTSLAAHP